MDYDKLFSTPRMDKSRYVTDSESVAEQLYHWNTQFSMALFASLTLIEIPLRNAIDRELRVINQILPDPDGTQHGLEWLLDTNYSIATSISEKAITRARTRAKLVKTNPTQDDVLAQMSFGNWRFILPSHSKDTYTKMRIWEEGLQDAFNLSDFSIEGLSKDIKDLQMVRNRIAHCEPLLKPNYANNTMRSIYRVAKSIDPELERYIKSTQRVTYINKQRPR
jgi:hypothetical protein